MEEDSDRDLDGDCNGDLEERSLNGLLPFFSMRNRITNGLNHTKACDNSTAKQIISLNYNTNNLKKDKNMERIISSFIETHHLTFLKLNNSRTHIKGGLLY